MLLSRTFSMVRPSFMYHNVTDPPRVFCKYVSNCPMNKQTIRHYVLIKSLQNLLFGNEVMDKWISNYNTHTVNTVNFGKWQELIYKGCRVSFQNSKIFVGNFDHNINYDQEYNLARVNEDYQADPGETLNDIISPDNIDAAREFLQQYISNIDISNQEWPALNEPVLLKNLPKLSNAVCAVAILSHHAGIALDYNWDQVNSQSQLEQDIDLTIEVFDKIKELGEYRNNI